MKSLFRDSSKWFRLSALAAVVFLPSLAHAHPVVPGHAHGLIYGLAHPITGLDHICAMIAVGLWAAQRGGRAIWLVPLTFVSVMAMGGLLGMASVPIPLVKQAIVVSVLVLGVLIAAAFRLPLFVSVIIVGLFAMFHGYEHGGEMTETASGFAYGVGFIFSTAILHLLGIGLGLFAQQYSEPKFVRYAGGAIAACGLFLCFA